MEQWSVEFDGGRGAHLILSIPELLEDSPEFPLLHTRLLTRNGSHLWRRSYVPR